MIFDIFTVLVFLLLILIHLHRGALRSLAGLIAAVVSYFAATALGAVISGKIYDAWVQPAIGRAIAQAVSDVGAGTAKSVADAVPQWLAGLMKASGDDLARLMKQPVANVGNSFAQAAEQAIRPVAIGVLTLLITVILFLLFFILLRFLIARPLNSLAQLPVLHGINKFFGAVIGFIDAFLVVSMAAYLIRLILSNSNTQFGWFSESTIYNSFIFYHFYRGNIFMSLSTLIAG